MISSVMVLALEIWFVLLFSLQPYILVISENVTCNSDDLRGLMGLVNGKGSPIDGWFPANSPSFSCCNWVGITCNSSSGRIVKIELPRKKLIGYLSDSVSYIDQLTTLNISDNTLNGPLPISLFHLTHLETVDLSRNYFEEDFPVSIDLPALQVLDISDNNFIGLLPFGLCINSTRIRVLSFAVNYFTGIIPPQFEKCNFLEQLSMGSNYLSGVIPDFLLRLPRLQKLGLEDNEFTAITTSGNSFSQLVRLDVSSNRLSGNIPDFFHRFPNLGYFSAHSNKFSGLIPPSLSNSPTIYSLILRNNSLDGSVDLNCSMMDNLASLDLSMNNFSGTIPRNLASCQKLKALNLARNRLIGQIPESFKNLHSLSYLSLSNCSLNNLSSSLKILQHCSSLTVLVLTMNFQAEQLPSDHDLQFNSLKALVIANCKLTGSIPSWLNGLTELQLLDLSWNDLTGSIPAFLGDFKYLFYLDLSNNSLSGEIPKNLTQLQSLISRDISLQESSPDFPFFKRRNMGGRRLALQYNQIMSFPPSIVLSRNLLNGPIWPEFGNLKKLQVLVLKRNNFSGMIPDSLSGMRSIETLDLSYNILTGRIPPSLERLTFLSKFSVAYNNLIGLVPTGGQFITFTGSSFEGNPGLCNQLLVNCQKPPQLMQNPASENKDISYLHLPVLTGFGTGFLVTVISLIVVPKIKGRYRKDKFEFSHG